MGQSKWVRAREEGRKMDGTQGAVSNHIEVGKADKASLNNAMKPLITVPGSPGIFNLSDNCCRGNMTGHEPSKRFLSGVRDKRQMLDGPAWGHVAQEEVVRAVVINSNLDYREPAIKVFRVLWG